MKNFNLIIVLLIFSISIFGQNSVNSKNKNFNSMPEKNHEEIILLKGKIVVKNYINKANRKFDYKEYYFESEDSSKTIQNYFIKSFENKITKQALDSINNQPISIKAILKNGLWDTNDPSVQSRFGNYIILVEILK